MCVFSLTIVREKGQDAYTPNALNGKLFIPPTNAHHGPPLPLYTPLSWGKTRVDKMAALASPGRCCESILSHIFWKCTINLEIVLDCAHALLIILGGRTMNPETMKTTRLKSKRGSFEKLEVIFMPLGLDELLIR